MEVPLLPCVRSLAYCLQLVCGLIQYLRLLLERDAKSSKKEIKTTHRSECGSDLGQPENTRTPQARL